MGAQVKILLEDGERPPIWVTICPVDGRSADKVMRATGDAVTLFIAGLQREEEAVARWLWNAEGLARRAIAKLYRQSPDDYAVWRHETDPFALLRDLACATLRVEPDVVDELRGEIS